MGSFINTLLSPIGIKPFSGGPYGDRELGSAALNKADQLGKYGTGLVEGGQKQTDTYQNALLQLFSQLANQNGVGDPYKYAGKSDADIAAMKTQEATGGAPQSDPFKLNGPFLTDYNNKTGLINQARQAALSRMKSDLSRRGLPNSTYSAAEQHLNDLFDTHVQNQLNTSAQNAFGSKNNALAALISGAFTGAGQGLNETGMGGGFLGNQINTITGQAGAAQQRTNQGNSDLMGGLGLIFGGVPGLGGRSSPTSNVNMGNPLANFGAAYGPGGQFGPTYGPEAPTYPNITLGYGAPGITNLNR